MDDMARVRLGEAARHLAGDVQGRTQRQRPAPDLRRQRFTVVKAHDDEEFSVGRFFQSVNHADVGVI